MIRPLVWTYFASEENAEQKVNMQNKKNKDTEKN